MKIAIIGGGWSGIYTAYQLKKICGDNNDIVIFEKEATIGGKCRNFLDKYPGGAIQFPYYEHFGKVLEEKGVNLVKKYRYNPPPELIPHAMITTIIKVKMYKTQEKYDNVLVSELFSADELSNLNQIVENYGYKEMTMFYFYKYLESFLNIRSILDIIGYITLRLDAPCFLEQNINTLMLEMSKDITTITNCEVKRIDQSGKKYNIITSNDIYQNLDIIVFSNVVNKHFDNIIPTEIITECDRLRYSKSASALLNKREYELLKKDVLLSLDIMGQEEYQICYFYETENLGIIPDNRKNVIETFFPRFEEPSKSQNLINSFQGKDRLFYTGGYLSFELIETICAHVQNFVIPEIRKIL